MVSSTTLVFFLLIGPNLASFNEQSQLNLSSVIKLINEEEDNNVLVAYATSNASLGKVFREVKSAVVINLGRDFNAGDFWKVNFYLIICNGIDQFAEFFRKFHRTAGWNSRGRFLVISFEEQAIAKYFELACKYLIVNFAVINQGMDVFTYVPFANNTCGCNTTLQNIFNLTTLSVIFPYRNLKEFNGCALKVLPLVIPPYIINTTSSRNPGFDVMILREIASRLNFQITYVNNPYRNWGFIMPDGSFTNMYSAITSGKANLMIGMAISNWTFVNAVDSIDGYVQEYIAFFVPAALPVDPWKNLTLVFSGITWFLILTSIMLTSLTFWLIDRTTTNQQSSLLHWLFISLSVLLASFNQKPGSLLLRALFALWSIYCLWIISAYQGNLISFLTKPSYHHQISTLDEMVNSRLTYGGYPTLKTQFLEERNPLFEKIYNNWKVCPLTEECINRTAQQRDFAVIKNPRQIHFLTPKYYTLPNGKTMLYELKETVNRFLIAFTFTKGFPLFERFGEIMLRLRENGLIDKWDKEHGGVVTGSAGNGGQVVVLTMEHLKVAFVMLIFGNCLALVVFLFELKMGQPRTGKFEL